MGVIIERSGDLLSSGESLAHCVSSDFHMNAGVARPIKHRFGGVRELLMQRKEVGEVAYLPREGRLIFYLVTKPRFFDRPTLSTLRLCLQELVVLCGRFRLKRLSVSRLGCGLDRLHWHEVREEMRQAFSSVDIVITVYYL